MKLSVQLLEARNLTVRPQPAHSGRHARRPARAYALIKVGNSACKSSVSASSPSNPNSIAGHRSDPHLLHSAKPKLLLQQQLQHSNRSTSSYLVDFSWFQEFIFEVDDLRTEIRISVWNIHDRFSNDTFLGRFHVPVSMVAHGANHDQNMVISSAWYPLQKRNKLGSRTPVTGEICVGFSLYGNMPESPAPATSPLSRDVGPNPYDSSVTTTPERPTISRPLSSDSLQSLDSTTSQNDITHHDASASLDDTIDSRDDDRENSNIASQDEVGYNSMAPTAPTVSSSSISTKRIGKSISSWLSNKVLRKLSLQQSKDAVSKGSVDDDEDEDANDNVRDAESDRSISDSTTIREIVSTDDKGSANDIDGTIKEVVSDADFEGTYNASENDMKLIPLSFFDGDDAGDDGVVTALNEIPPPLEGGILIEATYDVSARTMNKILFEPGSKFRKELSEMQKVTDLVEGPWIKGELGMPKRVVTYTKPATRLVKASNVVEDHMYTRADGKGFVVNVSASTPDVPYGRAFRTDIQYCIFSGRLGGASCLRVSWDVFFLRHTMMRGMIESGARQGLQDSYKEFEEVLEGYAKPLLGGAAAATSPARRRRRGEDVAHEAARKCGARSMWHAAVEYFFDLRVCVTLVSAASLLVVRAMYVSMTGPDARLHYKRPMEAELPYTFCEFMVAALVGAQLEYMIRRARKLLSAKLYRGSDHGVKAKGDGWILTVTLVGAQNVPACDEVGVPDPFVVFTCTGQSRTSSIKLKNFNPVWEERFEFDATEEAPSTMSVKIFDFEGPFSESESVGYAEINFLKQTQEQMADLWVPLEGKNARAAGCKIHLRVVLVNTIESKNAEEYIQRVGKEVGKKMTGQSFVKNTSFQKLFSLPSEEFLVNDFSCSLKRKFLLQGRLFLSSRVLAFYSNIFGHRTRFVILWEDVDEMKEASHGFGSVGALLNRSILVYTKKGRASDAQHGAKSMDEKGRFKFQFLSVIHYKPALRTMLVLWNYRTLSPEQRMHLIANIEQSDDTSMGSQYRQIDESEIFLGVDDAVNLNEVYAIKLPFPISSILAINEKENLEERVAEKMGRLNYFATPWVCSDEDKSTKHDEDNARKHLRRVTYKLSNRISLFATNVTCLQQRTSRDDGHALFIDELLTLHDVPFGNNFQIQVRKEIEDTPASSSSSSYCKVLMGVAWHKSSILQNQISKNIFERYTKHLKESIDVMVEEVLKYNKSLGSK